MPTKLDFLSLRQSLAARQSPPSVMGTLSRVVEGNVLEDKIEPMKEKVRNKSDEG
jgi:hypothetical protein